MSVKIRASKQPVLATEIKLAGSNEFAVGQYAGSGRGELNASSKRDLFTQQQKFLQAAAQGNMLAIDSATGRELVQAAFNDKESHRVLGEKIADALSITANRQGFMRKYLAKVDVQQGSMPRFPMRNKDVTAIWSTSPTKVESQIVRDKWFTPPELMVVTSLLRIGKRGIEPCCTSTLARYLRMKPWRLAVIDRASAIFSPRTRCDSLSLKAACTSSRPVAESMASMLPWAAACRNFCCCVNRSRFDEAFSSPRPEPAY
jgi:hypothetical protein